MTMEKKAIVEQNVSPDQSREKKATAEELDKQDLARKVQDSLAGQLKPQPKK